MDVRNAIKLHLESRHALLKLPEIPRFPVPSLPSIAEKAPGNAEKELDAARAEDSDKITAVAAAAPVASDAHRAEPDVASEGNPFATSACRTR
jgi:hypothetical protein